MLSGLINRWRAGRALREARQLNRDAPAIVDVARQLGGADGLRRVALETRAELARARAAMDANPRATAAVLDAVRARHREARRVNDSARLTSWTLVIIRLRAAALGEPAAPAARAIDEFLDAWEHVTQP